MVWYILFRSNKNYAGRLPSLKLESNLIFEYSLISNPRGIPLQLLKIFAQILSLLARTSKYGRNDVWNLFCLFVGCAFNDLVYLFKSSSAIHSLT